MELTRCAYHTGDALSCGNTAGWTLRDVPLCDECMSEVLRRSPGSLTGTDFDKISPVEAAAPSSEPTYKCERRQLQYPLVFDFAGCMSCPKCAAEVQRQYNASKHWSATPNAQHVSELYAQITLLQERGNELLEENRQLKSEREELTAAVLSIGLALGRGTMGLTNAK